MRAYTDLITIAVVLNISVSDHRECPIYSRKCTMAVYGVRHCLRRVLTAEPMTIRAAFLTLMNFCMNFLNDYSLSVSCIETIGS